MRTRERHAIYKKVLANAIECKVANGYNFVFGFCYAFKKALDLDRIIFSEFPEILKHKPKRSRRDDAYWWELDRRGDNKRLKVLRQAIEETKPKTSYKKTKTKAVKAKTKGKK